MIILIQRLFLVLLVTLCACSLFEKKSNYGEVPYRHQVRFKGESIGILAEWYTGDVTNWRRVVAINKNIDPQKIEIGDVILIPRDIIIRKEPLTEEFCNLKNQPSSAAQDPIESDFEKKFKSPLKTRPKRETEELIKNREELWDELIGE
jgi:hypothetical protein